MKITKILVAISFLFATVANAGELTVTGNMETTYQSERTGVTGNPLGMDKELKFAGSTELDNGITVSVMQDTTDALVFSNSQISFGNIAVPAIGMTSIYIGSDSDPIDAVDDITPSAYEEANGSGSGTYVDVGSSAGQMGLGFKFSVPMLGAVDFKHYPKVDSTKNSDNSASSTASSSVGSAYSVSIKTDLGALPGASMLDGLTWTNAFAEIEASTLASTDDKWEAISALNYAYGPVKVGVQKKAVSLGELALANTTTDTASVVHDDLIVGIAYAVNDNLSLSYNRITSDRSNSAVLNEQQETDAFNIGYTVGGMTIGFQDASTDNANYVLNAEDDTRTLGVSVAF